MSTIFNSQDNSGMTISGGGLIVTGNGGTEIGARANNSQYKGKFYFEVATSFGGISSAAGLGLGNAGANLNGMMASTGTQNVAVVRNGGAVYVNGSNVFNFGAAPSTVDVAVDLDNHNIWFRKDNGNWNNDVTANPATNTGGKDISAIDKAGLFPVAGADATANSFTFNFTTAARSVPSGFTTGWPDVSTISLDGAASKTANQSGVASLTNLNSLLTSGTNRILLAAVTLEKSGGAPTVTGVTDTAGLTWHLRKRFQFGASNGLCVELWWALAATQITSADTITFALSGTVDDSSVVTTAVFGPNLNTTSPFDADVTLPATATGSSTSPAVSSFAVDEEALVIALFGAGLGQASGGAVAQGTESSLIGAIRNGGGGLWSFITMEGYFKTAAASGLSSTTAAISSTTWGMVADAIKAGSAAADLFATIADDTGLSATIKVTTFCTWNPSNKGSNVALSNANLTMDVPSTGFGTQGGVTGTVGNNRGKKYFELTVSNISSLAQFNNWGVVFDPAGVDLEFARTDALAYKGTFRYGVYGGGGHFDLGGPITIGIEVDFTTGKVWANYVGGAFGAGTGFEQVATIDFGKTYYPWSMDTGQSGDGSGSPGPAATVTANFGASAFALTLPSGYASWDTLQGDDSLAPAEPTTYFLWSNGLDIHSDLLTLGQPTAGNSGAVAYSPQYQGKFYFEANWSVLTGLDGFGVAGPAADVTLYDHGAFTYFNNGDARASTNLGNLIADAGFGTGVWVGCAVDLDNWLIWWYNPGSAKWNNSGTANPETGVGGIDISAIRGMGVWPTVTIQGGSGDIVTFNFGGTSYAHTAPAGFGPWYKNDTALQMEFGDRTVLSQTSPAANTGYTSTNINSQGPNRTIVVDLVAQLASSGDAPLIYKISDSADLLWNKRQDIYDGATGFHFIRFWARASAQLSAWNFTITTPSAAPSRMMATARVFAGADTDPWDSGLPTSVWNDSATGAPITTSTVHPVSEEIIILGSVVYGGTGFDETLSSGGIEFEAQNISTFLKQRSAGQYYALGGGSAGHSFSWTLGAHPTAVAASSDVLRADTGNNTLWLSDTFNDEALLEVTGQFIQTTFTDQAVLIARLGFVADLADDLGLTATLRVADPGDLQATLVDDLGLSATMLELDIALSPQVVVIAC